ncbi:hypothetical protein BER93_00385 [Xanthomonas fragariae]|nr:hypothetical protein BER93_00385 [Xanthomonas fragariae]
MTIPSPASRHAKTRSRLEHDLTGEELPVRILQPTLAHRFIGQVVGVFEVEQTGNAGRPPPAWVAGKRDESACSNAVHGIRWLSRASG